MLANNGPVFASLKKQTNKKHQTRSPFGGLLLSSALSVFDGKEPAVAHTCEEGFS